MSSVGCSMKWGSSVVEGVIHSCFLASLDAPVHMNIHKIQSSHGHCNIAHITKHKNSIHCIEGLAPQAVQQS